MADNVQKTSVSDNSYQGKAIVSFPAESLILKEGEVNLDMYKIIQGKADMYMGYGTDKDVLLGIIGPGACFGELGLLMESPAIYTVVAYTDVYAIRVTEDRLGNFIQENHSSALQIMKNMANTMSIMQHQILSLSEELNTYTHKDEDNLAAVKKELFEAFYNPNCAKGKMYFMGQKGSNKK